MSSNWRCVLCFNATHVAARAAPKAGIVTYMDKCLSQGRDWKDIPVPRHFIFLYFFHWTLDILTCCHTCGIRQVPIPTPHPVRYTDTRADQSEWWQLSMRYRRGSNPGPFAWEARIIPLSHTLQLLSEIKKSESQHTLCIVNNFFARHFRSWFFQRRICRI